MKSPQCRIPRSILARALPPAIIAAGLAIIVGGCDGGREGDRCVPTSLRSSDECGSGYTCQSIGGCGESYCCPADPSKSSHPYCNGTGFDKCPAADASSDDASDAATTDANDSSTRDSSTIDSPSDAAAGDGSTD